MNLKVIATQMWELVWLPIAFEPDYEADPSYKKVLDWQKNVPPLEHISYESSGLLTHCQTCYDRQHEARQSIEAKADWVLLLLCGLVGLLISQLMSPEPVFNVSLAKASCIFAIPGMWLCLRVRIPHKYFPVPSSPYTVIKFAVTEESNGTSPSDRKVHGIPYE